MERNESDILLSNLAVTATSFVLIDFDGIKTTVNSTQGGKPITLVKWDGQIAIYDSNKHIILTKPVKFIKSIQTFSSCDINFVRIIDEDEGKTIKPCE